MLLNTGPAVRKHRFSFRGQIVYGKPGATKVIVRTVSPFCQVKEGRDPTWKRGGKGESEGTRKRKRGRKEGGKEGYNYAIFNTSQSAGVVVVSSFARILGDCSTIHSPPALFFLNWGLARAH